MTRTGSVRGKLLCPDDPGAVAGWSVGTGRLSFGPSTLMYAHVASATTGADGSFVFPEVPAGDSYVVEAFDPSRAHAVHRLEGRVVRPGEETVVELVAEKTVTVTGRVVDAGTGQPVAGVMVHFGGRLGQVYTGADGAFTFHLLPDELGPARLMASGYERQTVDLNRPLVEGRLAVGDLKITPRPPGS